MTEFEKRARIAGEKYVNPVAYGTPFEDMIFMEGAKWAVDEMGVQLQAEVMRLFRRVSEAEEDYLNETSRGNSLQVENEGIKAENEKLRKAIAKHVERYCPKSYIQSACTWMHDYDGLKAALDKSEAK